MKKLNQSSITRTRIVMVYQADFNDRTEAVNAVAALRQGIKLVEHYRPFGVVQGTTINYLDDSMSLAVERIAVKILEHLGTMDTDDDGITNIAEYYEVDLQAANAMATENAAVAIVALAPLRLERRMN